MARTKNEWDSDRAFPYNPLDEHEEPKEEDIIQEIFDKNYYHYVNKAKIADQHLAEDKFIKYRMWQHLYVTPPDPFMNHDYGSVVMKYLYFLLPGGLMVACYYIWPAKRNITHGKRYIFKRKSKY